MAGTLVLSVGMPRAGSGWHYNLIHDLVVATGGDDAHLIRKRYHLERILTEVNCNIGALTAVRLIPSLMPVFLGHTYAIKAHAGPRPLTLWFIRQKLMRVTYIYRDPRDALVSAYEYGKRAVQAGRRNAFSRLTTIEKSIRFMQGYVEISKAWLANQTILPVCYEDLLLNYQAEVEKLLDYLSFDKHDPAVISVIEKYKPESGRRGQKGQHFAMGKIRRFVTVLNPEQQQICQKLFSPYLEQVGYEL